MKKFSSFFTLLLLTGFGLHAQYTETFPIPNRGILSGPCTGSDGSTCLSSDFAGVNWTIEGDLSGIDTEPFATNASNQLVVSDIDAEACWVSPLLNITGGSVAFSLDLSWLGYDPDTGGGSDYIDVEYTTDDGTTWTQIPNQIGGGTHTIEYSSGAGTDGSTTISTSGITGSTGRIRVCIDHNGSTETTVLSNISATGAEVPGSGPTCDLAISDIMLSDENCVNAADGSIIIAASTSNGPLTYTVSGSVDRSNATGIFSNLPPGTYDITVDDDSFVPGTCRETASGTIAAGVDETAPTATEPMSITVTCLSDVPDPDPALIIDESDDCTVLCTTEPWINEFHYDNEGSDVGEFVEIAGPAGLDLSIYAIHTYDGADRMEDQILMLSGSIDDEQNGFGALSFEFTGLQNQTEGIALVKNGTEVVEFLSYEGSFQALDGPAVGLMSTDVGVEEPNTQAGDESLSRTGSGNTGAEFSFADQAASPGSLNENQSLTPCPENVPTVAFLEQSDNGGTGSESDPLVVSHIYRVTDAAGNFSDVTHLINVIDTEAPTAACISELSVTLDTAGIAVLTPEQFNMGSVDNCNATLSLDIDRDSLNCDDLGLLMITLRVTDAAGLSDTCTTMVTVTGDEEFCAMVPVHEPRRGAAAVPLLPLYPNPADKRVSVDLSDFSINHGQVDLIVYDALGKIVYRSAVARNLGALHILPTDHLAAGVYLVQLRTSRKAVAVNRLLISH